MNRSDKALLLCQTDSGNINLVNKYIQCNCEGYLEASEALTFLIRLCNYVSKGNPSNALTDEIYILTESCCRNRAKYTNSSEDSEKYLCSLYHIIKYMFNQKSLTYVLNLTEHIIPHCKIGACTSNVHKSLLILYHREVLLSFKNSNMNGWEYLVIKSLTLHKHAATDQYLIFFSRLITYCNMFTQPKITNYQRKKFCSRVLQLFQDVTTDENVGYDSYKAMMTLLNVIVCNIYSATDADVSNISTCAENILHVMKEMYKTEKYIKCILILENLFKSILKQLGSRTEKDLNILYTCIQIMDDLKSENSFCPVVLTTCCTMSRFLKLYTMEYFEKRLEQWETAFAPNILTSLFKLFELIGYIAFHKDISHAVAVSSLSGGFIDLYFQSKLDCTDELHILNLRCLKKSVKYILKMKETMYDKFVSNWKYVGSIIYNIGAELHKRKSYNHAKSYYYLFAKCIIFLEGVEDNPISFENALGSTLYSYASCCTYLLDNKLAMTFIALLMYLRPTFGDKALNMFIMIQSKKENEQLKKVTFKSILEQDQDIIRQIYPAFEYNEEKVQHLLLHQLEYYFKKWPSKLSIQNACKDLFLICDDIVTLTKAFNYSYEKMSVLNDKQYVAKLESTIYRLENKECKSSFINLLSLSCLYYFRYQFQSYELIQNNIQDMNEAVIPSQSTEQTGENEMLDIVPTYHNLKIETKLEQLAFLNKCLDLWEVIIASCDISQLQIITEFNIGKMIKNAAFEFRVHHFQYQMMRAWFIFLEYNKLIKNDADIIDSIGFIMEYTVCTAPQLQDLEVLAQELLQKLEKTNSKEAAENNLMFYINKSFGLIHNGHLKDAFDTFCIAQRYAQNVDSKPSVTKARLMHLKSIFLLTPCNQQFLSHQESFLLAAQEAFTSVANIYKNDISNDAYILSVLLDISLSNGWIYKWLRFPREVRCYTKESVKLAQRLALPIRTAQFLSLLAFTDILDRHFDDCEVKLDGLTKLLNYRSGIDRQEPIRKHTKLENANIGEPHLTPLVQFLDVPQRKCNIQVNGSPELSRKPFIEPQILLHNTSCACLCCTNFEYHKLIFEVVHLEAILSYYAKGKCQRVDEYLNGGFLLFKKFTTKYNLFLTNSLKYEHKAIYRNLPNSLNFSYCKLMLDYSHYLIAKSNLEEARNIVETIISMCTTHKQYTNVIFLSEVRGHEITLRYALQHKRSEENVSNQNLNVTYNTYVTKTPDNKILTTNVKLSNSPLPETHSKKRIKGLKLNFSDSEDDNDIVQKTPKPVKSTHYNFKSVATPGFKVPDIKETPAKVTKSESCLPAELTQSCEKTSKPSGSKLKSRIQLENRTKLLTEKLKAENVHNPTSAKKKPTTRSSAKAHKENVTPANSVDEIPNRMENLAIDTEIKINMCSQTKQNTKPKRTIAPKNSK